MVKFALLFRNGKYFIVRTDSADVDQLAETHIADLEAVCDTLAEAQLKKAQAEDRTAKA